MNCPGSRQKSIEREYIPWRIASSLTRTQDRRIAPTDSWLLTLENNTAALFSSVDGQGKASDISITAANLRVIDGDSQAGSIDPFVGTFGFDGGSSGSITINTSNSVLLEGADLSTLISQGGSTGTAGDIDITTAYLEVVNGAQLNTNTLGITNGDAGDITIAATGAIRLGVVDSADDRGVPSVIGSSALGQGTGGAGNVQITAANLQFSDGASIIASTNSAGAAGDILLDIDGSATFFGTTPDGQNPTGLFSRTFGQGEGGDIRLRAANLEVVNGASLSTETLGPRDAGDIVLEVAETVRVEGAANTVFENTTAVSPSLITSSIQETGDGVAGDVIITATNLIVTGGAALDASVLGKGTGGDVILTIAEVAKFEGVAPDGLPSRASSTVAANAEGVGGDVLITAGRLEVLAGAQLGSTLFGVGEAGNVVLDIAETARFEGANPLMPRFSSSANSSVEGSGVGGNVIVAAGNLEIVDGAQLSTAVFGTGEAGDIVLDIRGTVRLDGPNPLDGDFASALASAVGTDGSGSGGDIRITAEHLEINDEGFITAENRGTGETGNIFINLQGDLAVTDGEIKTTSAETTGGRIEVAARDIRLFGDSDFRTIVQTGEGSGGDITLTADSIVALDDSDILAFSADGTGGNIFLNTPAFFGENFQPATQLTTREDLEALDGNDRVDVNATGGITSGTLTFPDVSFIQNSLNDLSEGLIDPSTLISNSCIAGSGAPTDGNFIITGRSGLPLQPGDTGSFSFSTGSVRAPAAATTEAELKPGDRITEPDGIYHLADGRLILSHRCQTLRG